jgi:hypothetical protein
MKKLELNQMENLKGSSACGDYLAKHSDLNSWEGCVVCAGAGSAVVGGIFGGPAGILGGWVGGTIGGMFTC